MNFEDGMIHRRARPLSASSVKKHLGAIQHTLSKWTMVNRVTVIHSLPEAVR